MFFCSCGDRFFSWLLFGYSYWFFYWFQLKLFFFFFQFSVFPPFDSPTSTYFGSTNLCHLCHLCTYELPSNHPESQQRKKSHRNMMKSSSEHLLRLDVNRTPERKSSVHLPMGAQCAICLFVITDRALLESCAHEFCRVCLLEWSKLSRDCPLCRRQFNCVQTNSGKLAIPAILPLSNTTSMTTTNNTNSTGNAQPISRSFENRSSNGELVVVEGAQVDGEQSDEGDEEDDALQNSQLVQQLNRQFERGDLNVDCDQLNSLINQLFGHVQSEEGELQWPFWSNFFLFRLSNNHPDRRKDIIISSLTDHFSYD